MQVLESSITRVIEISGVKYYIDTSIKWPNHPEDNDSMETKIKVATDMGANDDFCIDIKGNNLGDMATLLAELQRVIQVVSGGAYQTPVPMGAAPAPMITPIAAPGNPTLFTR